MNLTHIGLFAGIGGFELAARWAGWETVAWCEKDPFCQAVLNYHFPNAEALSDIKTINFTKYAGKIDVLTGGFPCQPYSLSGKRLGKADDRHLWPEMLRAIREIAPRWVVGENVYGLINWNAGVVFEEVQTDLENEGYSVQAYLLPAVGVDAPHKRYRVWFVAHRADARAQGMRQRREDATHGPDAIAYAIGKGLQVGTRPKWTELYKQDESLKRCEPCRVHSTFRKQLTAHANSARWIQSDERASAKFKFNCKIPNWRRFPTEQPICSRNDGFPGGLVRIAVPSRKGRRFLSERQAKARLRREAIKAYGNAVVPQLVYQIFKTINEYERKHTTQPHSNH